MNLSNCDFVVISQRTGNATACFLLPGDASAYIAWRKALEGPNYVGYEVVNSDGSMLVSQPYERQSFMTFCDGRQFVAVER